AELSRQGVHAGGVSRVAGAATALTEIALEGKGERRFVHESYAIHERFNPREEEWASLTGARHVHATRMPRHLERLRSLGASGAHVSYDFLVDPLPERLEGFELVFLPHDALPPDSDPAQAARELVERGCTCAIITLGS